MVLYLIAALSSSPKTSFASVSTGLEDSENPTAFSSSALDLSDMGAMVADRAAKKELR